MHDWNNNGKRDMMDSYIDYSIYKEITEKGNGSNHSSGNECSGFVAFLVTISGLIIQVLIYTILDIDVDNVPALVMVFLWIFFDVIVAMGLVKMGKM